MAQGYMVDGEEYFPGKSAAYTLSVGRNKMYAKLREEGFLDADLVVTSKGRAIGIINYDSGLNAVETFSPYFTKQAMVALYKFFPLKKEK